MRHIMAAIAYMGMVVTLAWGLMMTVAGSTADANQVLFETVAKRPGGVSDAITQKQSDKPTYADVAPIFNQRCISCHAGPKAPKGLRLDTYTGVMAGAKGPVVIPGDPVKSDIVRHIRGTGKPRMPMNGPPWLSESEITLIENWIKAGAPEGKSA